MTVTEKKSRTPNESRPNGESGVALIIALLAITILMGIGFALMLSSSTESMIHGSFRRESMAFYAARGGLEEARGRMGPDAAPLTTTLASVKIPCSDPGICPPLYDPAAALSATNPNPNLAYYIRLNGSINPTAACTYLGMNCTDPNPPATLPPTFFLTTQAPLIASVQPAPMPYAWVKIEVATELKLNRDINGDGTMSGTAQVYWDQRNLSLTPGNPTNPAYIFTALSIQPGRATRRLREVASIGKIPGLPGPLTLDGFPATYIPPTSNPFMLSGCDAGSTLPCNPTNAPPHAPSVVMPNNTDRNTAQATIFDSNKCNPPGPPMGGCQPGTPDRNGDYRGSTNSDCSNPNCASAGGLNAGADNSASIVSATDTTVFPTDPLATNPFFADCAGVQSLQAYITQGADFIYNGDQGSLSTPGSLNNNNAIINVINGNATLGQNDMRPSPSDRGFGILLVTGDLTISGSSDYNGVIIVLGGTLFVSGGGGGTIIGGIFVADTTTCPSTLGPATFDPSGGGNFTIQYDSRYANPQTGFLPMQILSLNY